ncbi:MAG: pseudouridine synthase [Verrucomicrobiales bacterium]|nr:pseudouridine synthase [Verrucomicrobiales bacterium]
MSGTPSEGVRLNKFLASCGLGSRRGCEDFIKQGLIEINGQVVTSLGARVLPNDHVRYDGKLLRQESELTLLFNKPEGFLCTRHDPQGRKTIYDILPVKFGKLNYIGRLDYNSSGLILLTNSGELNEKLTHPRYHIEKEYHVQLNRVFDPALKDRLLEGFRFDEGHAKADEVEIVGRKRLNLVLTQGFNRQIRRMFSKLDYKVKKLERFRIGSLVDYDLEIGKFRVMDHRMLQAASKNPGKDK